MKINPNNPETLQGLYVLSIGSLKASRAFVCESDLQATWFFVNDTCMLYFGTAMEIAINPVGPMNQEPILSAAIIAHSVESNMQACLDDSSSFVDEIFNWHLSSLQTKK